MYSRMRRASVPDGAVGACKSVRDEIADWLKHTAEDYYPALKKGRVAVMDSYG